MIDHIEKAAKEEYETTHEGTWDDAHWQQRIIYYASANRIVASYLHSLNDEVQTKLHNPVIFNRDQG